MFHGLSAAVPRTYLPGPCRGLTAADEQSYAGAIATGAGYGLEGCNNYIDRAGDIITRIATSCQDMTPYLGHGLTDFFDIATA